MSLRVGEIYVPYIDNAEPLLLECKHFIECVQNNSRPHSDGENGLEVIRIMRAATSSMHHGGRSVRL